MTPSSLAAVQRQKTRTGPGRETALAVHPAALSIRARLRERRTVSVQRHTGRVTTRFLVLVLGDLLAWFAYQAVGSGLSATRLQWDFVSARVQTEMASNPSGGWLFAILLLTSLFLTGSYSRHRAMNGPVRLLGSAVIASSIILITIEPSIGWTVATVLFGLTVLVTWMLLLAERQLTENFLHNVWPRDTGTAPALLITTGSSSDNLVERAMSAPAADYRIAARIVADSDVGDKLWTHIRDTIDNEGIEAVILCGPLSPPTMHTLMELTLKLGAQLLYPARAVKIPDVRPALVWHSDQPFFELGAPVLKATALITKRIVDILGAAIGLLICGPLLVLIAIGVKLDSPGPVMFSQFRAGLGGKRFRMLKFRTMTVDAEDTKQKLSHLNKSGDPRLFKIPGDPRITRLGQYLRRWSLDELPQMFNVLVGEMSIVGPRPFFESDFLSYEDHHFRRLDAKPGITGLWQVSGGSEVLNFEDVVFLDRQYIEQWSFWLDLSIIFRTIPAIFRRSEIY